MSLIWENIVSGNPDNTHGFVGANVATKASNRAFTITKTPDNKFQLESFITGKENLGGTFLTIAEARAAAVAYIAIHSIPTNGTATLPISM